MSTKSKTFVLFMVKMLVSDTLFFVWKWRFLFVMEIDWNTSLYHKIRLEKLDATATVGKIYESKRNIYFVSWRGKRNTREIIETKK